MSELFVRRQVDFQLYGSASPTLDFSGALKSERHHRSSLFMALAKSGTDVLPERWASTLTKSSDGQWSAGRQGQPGKSYRNSDVLNEFQGAGSVPRNLFFDMQDAVYRTQSTWPTVQYNRRKGSRNAILWPLKGFHDIGDARFFGSGIEPPNHFARKRPIVVWRGALVGHVTRDGVRTNIQTVIKEMNSGELSTERGLDALRQLSRFRAAEQFSEDPHFDVGFVIPNHLTFYEKCQQIFSHVKDHMSIAEMSRSRYLLALAGNDVATCFAWGAATSSLILKEDYEWEVFYDGHFQPWVHYVPIRSDLSDLEAKVAWCEANIADCVQMISAANEQSKLLCNPDLRIRTLRNVAMEACRLVQGADTSSAERP